MGTLCPSVDTSQTQEGNTDLQQDKSGFGLEEAKPSGKLAVTLALRLGPGLPGCLPALPAHLGELPCVLIAPATVCKKPVGCVFPYDLGIGDKT